MMPRLRQIAAAITVQNSTLTINLRAPLRIGELPEDNV